MDALLPTIFSGMIVLSVALLVIGVVKPKWIHFWQKRPGCLTITAIALILLVIGLSEAGEIRPAGMNDVETLQPADVRSEAAYPVSNVARQCKPGKKSGRAGGSDDEKTASGIRYMVKTPAHYDASVAHPLVMVYAPARTNRYQSEDFVHLTQEATAAGFLVAYADHRRLSPKAIEELAAIPGLIEQKWCIDDTRIFLTGHSDGGTTAMAIAFLDGTKYIPAAIAPSAMGIRGEDLKAYQCPNPLPVMLLHSGQDRLFPGYGKEAIQWWAACNGCEATPPVQDADGCVTYKGCKNKVATRYCEGTGSHTTWPGNNKAIIEFFRGSQDLR
jgi:polyhydroxybutyrate depolymerase